MRKPRPRRIQAFTLVELMIVIIILGILATVIIALFSNSSRDAAATALKDNLRAMRSSLQLYAAQHVTYPSVANFEAQMTEYSDAAGNVSASASAAYPFGPYIQRMPNMPVGIHRGMTTVTGPTYTAGFGWLYDPATGYIKANLPDSDVDNEGVLFNTY